MTVGRAATEDVDVVDEIDEVEAGVDVVVVDSGGNELVDSHGFGESSSVAVRSTVTSLPVAAFGVA